MKINFKTISCFIALISINSFSNDANINIQPTNYYVYDSSYDTLIDVIRALNASGLDFKNLDMLSNEKSTVTSRTPTDSEKKLAYVQEFLNNTSKALKGTYDIVMNDNKYVQKVDAYSKLYDQQKKRKILRTVLGVTGGVLDVMTVGFSGVIAKNATDSLFDDHSVKNLSISTVVIGLISASVGVWSAAIKEEVLKPESSESKFFNNYTKFKEDWNYNQIDQKLSMCICEIQDMIQKDPKKTNVELANVIQKVKLEFDFAKNNFE